MRKEGGQESALFFLAWHQRAASTADSDRFFLPAAAPPAGALDTSKTAVDIHYDRVFLPGVARMRAVTVTAICLSLLAACAREPEVSTATATNSAAPAAKTAQDWPLFVEEFIKARMAANPFDAIAQ